MTEKAIKKIEKNIYTFDVDVQLTKKQIKKTFEELYSVRISSIKTHRLTPRKKGQKPVKRVLLCLPSVEDLKFSTFSSDKLP